MQSVSREVTGVLEAYAAAVLDRDPDRLLSLYDPSVRVFDAWGVWSYEVAAAWRSAVHGWLSSLDGETVTVSFADLKTSDSAEMVVVTAIVTYAAHSLDGAPIREMQNRITWVLQSIETGLRIVHEHTSAPIGFDDSKAILTR